MPEERLAIEGGEKAAGNLGPFPSKIGKDELLEVLDLWQMSPENTRKIRQLIENEKNLKGPHLFRYYNPRPSKVAAAEEAMKQYIGSQYCMAANSCTSALVAAYRALGVGAGDEVIVPAYTFFATAAAVVSSNAIPVIVDVDETLCMDPRAVDKAITKRTRAIVPVLSGEGGFLTTDDKRLYTRALNWHDCAACWRPDRFGPEQEGEELFCGENYRMSELEGAVALAQISKAGQIISKHRAAKKRIKDRIEEFPGLAFRKLADPQGDTGICLIIFLPSADITRKVLPALQAEGVPCGGIYDSKVRDWHTYNYWEHILQKKTVANDGLPWKAVAENKLPRYSKDMCPKSLQLLSRSILIDIDYNLSDYDCEAIAAAINKVLRVMLKS